MNTCIKCGKKHKASDPERETCLQCKPDGCAMCGRQFARNRGRQKFCSAKCVTMHNKQRRSQKGYEIIDGKYHHVFPCRKCGVTIKTTAGSTKWCNKCRAEAKDQSKTPQPRKEVTLKKLGYSVQYGIVALIMRGERY